MEYYLYAAINYYNSPTFCPANKLEQNLLLFHYQLRFEWGMDSGLATGVYLPFTCHYARSTIYTFQNNPESALTNTAY